MKSRYTLQVVTSQENSQLFNEAFNQSEANSKGEFLSILLKNWLNPDEVREIQIPVESPDMLAKIKVLEENINVFRNHPVLTDLLSKNKGKIFKVKSREIKVETTLDIFEICMANVINQ